MNKFGIHYAFWGDRWDVDMCERVLLAADAGFEVLEVTPPEYMTNLDKAKMSDLKKCAEDNGVEMTFCIGFPREKDMSSPDASVRAAGIDYSKRMIEAVHYMGGKVLSGILYSWWPYSYDTPITPDYKADCWKRGVESVGEVAPLAAAGGILYAIEMVNRFEQFIVNSTEEGKRFCRDVGTPNMRLLIDVFHANIEENSIADAIRSAGKLLAHMHWSENNRRLPGTGHMPWNEIVQALKDIDYRGHIVFEPFIATGGPVGNDLRIWRDLDPDTSVPARQNALKKSLQFAKKLMGC
ncbi:MAG: sugar phosphate isomerase/epimerase [Synergistaceae bacterium]|nr:sugar phosphate isomerase/epimerase [Synergistaceae bacterium]